MALDQATTDDAPSDGGALSDDAGPAQRACAGYAEAYCEQQGRCDRGTFLGAWGDLGVCRERAARRCQARLEVKGSSWTPPEQETCNGALAALDCAAFPSGTPAACVPRPGALPDESPCGHDFQCQGLFCRKPSGKDCGTCSRRGTVGAACTRFDCERGLWCKAGLCAPLGRIGEPCDGARPCEEILSCVGQYAAGGGTCQKGRGPGEPCGNNLDCGYFPDPLDCQPVSNTTRVCQLRPAGVGPGQACKVVEIECRGFGQCTNGVCVAPLPDGSPCSDPTACLPESHCVGGVCRYRDGSTCQ